MAKKRLYTVCILGASSNRITDAIVGFTVADSEDEVHRIAQMHLPRKRVYVRMATAGESDPVMAARVADIFLDHGIRWLDPRPARERGIRGEIPQTVAQLIAS